MAAKRTAPVAPADATRGGGLTDAVVQRLPDTIQKSATPPVSDADALADRSWFAENPTRNYRLRRDVAGRLWAVRRRPRGVVLRTPVRLPGAGPQAGERLAETIWWA